MNENIIILGGNGFIGKNIASDLIKRNKNVTIFDVKESITQSDNIKYYVGKIEDRKKLNEALLGQDIAIYLATNITPQSSMDSIESVYLTELPQLAQLLEASKDIGLKRILFASSGGTVYGDNGYEMCKEESPTNPLNHYGIVKLASEKMLILYNKLYGMENIILRISNPYGIGQEISSGVGAVTAFASNLMKGETIQIYGDGSIIRDYIEIEDVAKAFALAVDLNIKEALPVFNIGSGVGVSLNELLSWISVELDILPTINNLPERPFDLRFNVLCIDKAKAILGFAPSSNPREGIVNYIKKLKKIEYNKVSKM